MDYYGLITVPPDTAPDTYINTLVRITGVPCFTTDTGASPFRVLLPFNYGELMPVPPYETLYITNSRLIFHSELTSSSLLILFRRDLDVGEMFVPLPHDTLYVSNSHLKLQSEFSLSSLVILFRRDLDSDVPLPHDTLYISSSHLKLQSEFLLSSLLILFSRDLVLEEIVGETGLNNVLQVLEGRLQIAMEIYTRLTTHLWRHPYYPFRNMTQLLKNTPRIVSSAGIVTKMFQELSFIVHQESDLCIFISGHLGSAITQAIDILNSLTEAVYTYTDAPPWPGVLAPATAGNSTKVFIYGGIAAIPPYDYMTNIFAINLMNLTALCFSPNVRRLPYWEVGSVGNIERQGAVGLSSTYEGYFVGGVATLPISEIEKLVFVTVTMSLLQSKLSIPRGFSAELCSSTTGYIFGGYSRLYPQNVIESFQFSTNIVSTLSSSLPFPASHIAGNNSHAVGYLAGGFSTVTTPLNTIMKFPFGTESLSIIAQTLSVGRHSLCGCQSPFKGYYGGGFPTEYTTEIDAIIYDTETYQDVSASLSQAKGYVGAWQTAGV